MAHSFKVGDKVHFDADTVLRRPEFTGTFTVEKINPKNIKVLKVMTEAGGRQVRVNASPIYLRAGEAPSAGEYDAFLSPEVIEAGTLVHVQNLSRIKNGFYVITGETRTGYKMTSLGGANGTWSNVPRAAFTVVPVTDNVLDALHTSLSQAVLGV